MRAEQKLAEIRISLYIIQMAGIGASAPDRRTGAARSGRTADALAYNPEGEFEGREDFFISSAITH
jgi:hypothetical protein